MYVLQMVRQYVLMNLCALDVVITVDWYVIAVVMFQCTSQRPLINMQVFFFPLSSSVDFHSIQKEQKYKKIYPDICAQAHTLAQSWIPIGVADIFYIKI